MKTFEEITAAQEMEMAFSDGLMEPPLAKAGDHRVLINYTPPVADCRIISEGQYQAMLKVWMRAGYAVIE